VDSITVCITGVHVVLQCDSRAICVVVQGSFTSVFISAWQRDSAMVDAVVKCLNRNFDIPQQVCSV